MKCRFSINYNTEWGQSVHVVVSTTAADGRERSRDFAMQTTDGALWTLDAALMESRRQAMVSFRYVYQVENAEGRVLRREWDAVPRCYAADATKTFCFADQWRDRPLHHHLYTFAVKRYRRGVQPVALPLFRRTMVFRVSAPQLQSGESVALIGSHPAIGSWNPTRYLPMQHVGEYEWMLSVNADGMREPPEFKYVVVDNKTRRLTAWEEGDNRTAAATAADGEVVVCCAEPLRVKEREWRAAGMVVPVGALRTEHSCGVGDFGDLKMLADWAAATGMSIIQLLPVNDTTRHHDWNDSHPYNIVSAFALHPLYMDLKQLPQPSDAALLSRYARRRRELNALRTVDYPAVERVKREFISSSFAEHGAEVKATAEYKAFCHDNADWLDDYARYCTMRDGNNAEEALDEVRYTQYHLHRQLATAARYARSLGVGLKGDLPIGVCGDGADVMSHPELFCTDTQMGTPPDNTFPRGQNWGFPTFRAEAADEMVAWFRRRFRHMEQYFDAFRIDHAVGWFRVWEIPDDAVFATLGHFVPALPMSGEEIEQMGLAFHRELYTRPFINDRLIDRLFGLHAAYVREHFLTARQYGLYDLKPEYSTQRRVEQHFRGRTDESSLWISDGLCRLVANVLFIEDRRRAGMYHPRYGADRDVAPHMLGPEEREAYRRIYDSYFQERHNDYWAHHAARLLDELTSDTRMLVCAEDLGTLPRCVPHVLDALRVLTLEVQRMPKDPALEFAHLEANPVRSVATIETHDMPPLRLWWEENQGRAQRYFTTMMQREGRAPAQLSATMAEEIVARHLYCPSMLCLISIQDWLAMDASLRSGDVHDERINDPSDSFNRWSYRMPVTLEQLLAAQPFNKKLKTMIKRSRRNHENV